MGQPVGRPWGQGRPQWRRWRRWGQRCPHHWGLLRGQWWARARGRTPAGTLQAGRQGLGSPRRQSTQNLGLAQRGPGSGPPDCGSSASGARREGGKSGVGSAGGRGSNGLVGATGGTAGTPSHLTHTHMGRTAVPAAELPSGPRRASSPSAALIMLVCLAGSTAGRAAPAPGAFPEIGFQIHRCVGAALAACRSCSR
jgi:hypothetical protein